ALSVACAAGGVEAPSRLTLMLMLALRKPLHACPITRHVCKLLGATPALQLALQGQCFVTRFEFLGMDQLQGPAFGGVTAAFALIVLLHACVQIVRVSD